MSTRLSKNFPKSIGTTPPTQEKNYDPLLGLKILIPPEKNYFYKCKFCEKAFFKPDDLNIHANIMHSTNIAHLLKNQAGAKVTFKCQFCKQVFVPFSNKKASSDFRQLFSCDRKRIVSKVEERKDYCQQRLYCFDHRMNIQYL